MIIMIDPAGYKSCNSFLLYDEEEDRVTMASGDDRGWYIVNDSEPLDRDEEVSKIRI